MVLGVVDFITLCGGPVLTVAPPHVPLHDAHRLDAPTVLLNARQDRPLILILLLPLLPLALLVEEEGDGLGTDDEGGGRRGGVLIQLTGHAIERLMCEIDQWDTSIFIPTPGT